jgi:tRNA(adenine34) deaminase
MFNNKPFELILQTLNQTPQEDFPVASFLEVDGVYFKPFTNKVYKDKSHLKHAEILAINYTLKKLKIMDFKGKKAILYCSLEPCCMCFSFASLVRISRVVCFAKDDKFGGSGRIFTLNSSFTKPEFIFIEKEEIKTLMNNFFKQKR